MKGKIGRTASHACVVTGIQNMTEMQNHKSQITSQPGLLSAELKKNMYEC
jgi:hypothetical protein